MPKAKGGNLMIWLFIILFFNQASTERSPQDLIRLATTRPWPGENYPVLPTLPTVIRDGIVHEINSSRSVRKYYEKLDATNRTNVEWFDGVAGLQKERAIWSLLSGLCHPSDDVQLHALKSLAIVKDKRVVPFLLIYAEYMAVYEDGSENATIHGILHQSIAKTLSEITGVAISINDQDPEKLKEAIRLWRKWEYETNPK
jgi:hypothetical protein